MLFSLEDTYKMPLMSVADPEFWRRRGANPQGGGVRLLLPPASEGWGKVMFSLVSVCLSTPPAGQATYAGGSMPLAVSQEDFLV